MLQEKGGRPDEWDPPYEPYDSCGPGEDPAGLNDKSSEPLGENALAAELAGVLKDDLAVAFVMVIEYDARMRLADQLGELGLALLDRLPPHANAPVSHAVASAG